MGTHVVNLKARWPTGSTPRVCKPRAMLKPPWPLPAIAIVHVMHT
jgi:hypothetical protein